MKTLNEDILKNYISKSHSQYHNFVKYCDRHIKSESLDSVFGGKISSIIPAIKTLSNILLLEYVNWKVTPYDTELHRKFKTYKQSISHGNIVQTESVEAQLSKKIILDIQQECLNLMILLGKNHTKDYEGVFFNAEIFEKGHTIDTSSQLEALLEKILSGSIFKLTEGKLFLICNTRIAKLISHFSEFIKKEHYSKSITSYKIYKLGIFLGCDILVDPNLLEDDNFLLFASSDEERVGSINFEPVQIFSNISTHHEMHNKWVETESSFRFEAGSENSGKSYMYLTLNLNTL